MRRLPLYNFTTCGTETNSEVDITQARSTRLFRFSVPLSNKAGARPFGFLCTTLVPRTSRLQRTFCHPV